MFSKTCQYAIKAVVCIAELSKDSQRAGLQTISHEIDSPEHFTAKILQQLVKNNIVSSVKGPNGGFYIDVDKMRKVKLNHIVKLFDGERIYTGCGLGLKSCSAKQPCPVHDKFKVVRTNLKLMLQSTSVYDLTIGLKHGLTFLKRI